MNLIRVLATFCMAAMFCEAASAQTLQASPEHVGRRDIEPAMSALPSLLLQAGDKVMEPDGSLSWKALGRITIEKRENTNNRFGRGVAYFAEPVVAPEVRALGGKRVKIKGYVLPRKSEIAGNRYLISALPAVDKDGCTVGGNETFVDIVLLESESPNMNSLVVVEGVMTFFDIDKWGGYIYKLSEPRIISGS